MPGILFEKIFPKFQNRLHKDECYFIHNPSHADNGDEVNHYNCKKKISFLWQTSIMKCNNFQGPKYGFEFTSYETILDATLSKYSRVDIIDYVVTRYEKQKRPTVYNEDSIVINLKLQNLDGKILNVILWDAYCEEMFNYMVKKKDKHVVLILQFRKYNNYNDRVTVSNDRDVSRLFINEEIDEIVSFKKSFLDKNLDESSSPVRSISSSMVSSVADVFLKDNDFSPVNDIKNINMVKSLIVVGKIKGICNDKSWHYLSCDLCKTCVESKLIPIPKGDDLADFDVTREYKCSNSRCTRDTILVPINRFKIPIIFQDVTGIVCLTMFDIHAKLLLGITSSMMIEKELQMIEANMGNADFSALFERKLAFKIEIKDYNITNNAEFYCISVYTEHSGIIATLEENFDVLRADDADSRSITISDFPFQKEVCLKDSVSFTDDNGTPLSTNQDVAGKTTSVDLKRNLNEVYDVDELDESISLSSTKQPKSLIKIDGDEDNKLKILIPKIEK